MSRSVHQERRQHHGEESRKPHFGDEAIQMKILSFGSGEISRPRFRFGTTPIDRKLMMLVILLCKVMQRFRERGGGSGLRKRFMRRRFDSALQREF
jgi:hypothetical protein